MLPESSTVPGLLDPLVSFRSLPLVFAVSVGLLTDPPLSSVVPGPGFVAIVLSLMVRDPAGGTATGEVGSVGTSDGAGLGLSVDGALVTGASMDGALVAGASVAGASAAGVGPAPTERSPPGAVDRIGSTDTGAMGCT